MCLFPDKLSPCFGRLGERGILKCFHVSLKSDDRMSTASEQSSVVGGVKRSTRSTSCRQDVICIFGEDGEVSNCS